VSTTLIYKKILKIDPKYPFVVKPKIKRGKKPKDEKP